MSIYTKKGDLGMTDMLTGTRVLKTKQNIIVLGHIDELTSQLGFVRSGLENQEIIETIKRIQNELIEIMSVVASDFATQIELKKSTKQFEDLIDQYQTMYPKLTGFVIPGDYEITARIDIARAVTRRVERSLIILLKGLGKESDVGAYFNRLSDYLFALARMISFREQIKEAILSVNKEAVSNSHENDKYINTREMNANSFINNEAKDLLSINLLVAKAIATMIEEEAISKGLQIVICLVNKEGNIVLLHAMDEAYLVSVDLSMKKAYTSMALKMPTHELAELTKKGADFEGLEAMLDREIITLGGGYPIIYNSKVIGAVGVSGSTVEHDIYLAKYGSKSIERVCHNE